MRRPLGGRHRKEILDGSTLMIVDNEEPCWTYSFNGILLSIFRLLQSRRSRGANDWRPDTEVFRLRRIEGGLVSFIDLGLPQ